MHTVHLLDTGNRHHVQRALPSYDTIQQKIFIVCSKADVKVSLIYSTLWETKK